MPYTDIFLISVIYLLFSWFFSKCSYTNLIIYYFSFKWTPTFFIHFNTSCLILNQNSKITIGLMCWLLFSNKHLNRIFVHLPYTALLPWTFLTVLHRYDSNDRANAKEPGVLERAWARGRKSWLLSLAEQSYETMWLWERRLLGTTDKWSHWKRVISRASFSLPPWAFLLLEHAVSNQAAGKVSLPSHFLGLLWGFGPSPMPST